MAEKLPKILSISLSTWNKNSGIHTQTDLFKFWDKERLAQIYLKSDLPNTPVCDNFFQISENAIIKSVIKRNPVGKRVYNTESADEKTMQAIEEENKLYQKAHKKKSWFMTLLRELIWSLGKWKTKALDEFIKEENPDVYFVPIYPVSYTAKIQRYIIKKYPKPYVCYLADDNYSYDGCGANIFAYIHRFFLRKQVKFLAKNCSQMFTITDIEGEDTDRRFGTKSVVLTKGIDYSNLTYEKINPSSPVKMVYTGNMLIGRDYSLIAISKALKKINMGGEKITLDIYSPTVLDDKKMEYLNSNGVHYKGRISKEEVLKVQSEADVVVFVESLEKKYKNAAKLSFSTKLTDYFKSGKCIFAIGDKGIAPIRYLQNNDAAIISVRYDEIEGNLRRFLDEEGLIDEYGKKSFDCGYKNHNEEKVKKTFIDTFIKAIE